MAELAAASNIAETRADSFLNNRSEPTAPPRCKTAAAPRDPPLKQPAENIEESHSTGELCR